MADYASLIRPTKLWLIGLRKKVLRSETLFPSAREEGQKLNESLQALEQIVGAGHVGFAGRVLDVERLHHAVVDHHGVASRTHAEATLGEIRRDANRLGPGGAA